MTCTLTSSLPNTAIYWFTLFNLIFNTKYLWNIYLLSHFETSKKKSCQLQRASLSKTYPATDYSLPPPIGHLGVDSDNVSLLQRKLPRVSGAEVVACNCITHHSRRKDWNRERSYITFGPIYKISPYLRLCENICWHWSSKKYHTYRSELHSLQKCKLNLIFKDKVYRCTAVFRVRLNFHAHLL